MSLKRFALIAATSLHHHQHKQEEQETTTTAAAREQQIKFMNATKSTAKIVTTSIEIVNEDDNNNNITTTPTTTITGDEETITPALAPAVVQPHFILNPVVSGPVSGETNVAVSVSTPSITTYYGGGLGVFHQQNIRAGSTGSYFGASGTSLSGAGGTTVGGSGSYAHTINGNVNLLLGG